MKIEKEKSVELAGYYALRNLKGEHKMTGNRYALEAHRNLIESFTFSIVRLGASGEVVMSGIPDYDLAFELESVMAYNDSTDFIVVLDNPSKVLEDTI